MSADQTARPSVTARSTLGVFEQHHTSAVTCGPSRSVMTTGLQPADIGMFDNTEVPFQKDMSRKIRAL